VKKPSNTTRKAEFTKTSHWTGGKGSKGTHLEKPSTSVRIRGLFTGAKTRPHPERINRAEENPLMHKGRTLKKPLLKGDDQILGRAIKDKVRVWGVGGEKKGGTGLLTPTMGRAAGSILIAWARNKAIIRIG